MLSYAAGAGRDLVDVFERKVYDGTIIQDMMDAEAYVKLIGGADRLEPLGIACPKTTAKAVHAEFRKDPPPKQMSFSATIWMLDLGHRLLPFEKMDFARMRWALGHLTRPKDVHQVLGKLIVRAESVPVDYRFSGLQRVERDADVDAVLLAVHWNKPPGTTAHPWHAALRDLVFAAEAVGSGVDVTVNRFWRYEEEEKKKNVMGLSAYRRAQELKLLVDQGASLRNGQCDAALAADLLGTKQELKATWSKDTCHRYLTISKRFDAAGDSIMNKWEMKFGRGCLLDHLHQMRSATTAAQSPEEMTALVATLSWEQTCKIRTSLGHRTKQSAGDSTALCRALLLRRLFYKYIQQIFPKLSDILSVYGTWEWYKEQFGMDEHGRVAQGADSSEEESDGEGQQKEGHQTRFESKRKLKLFMDQVAKGKHDNSFTSMARHTSSATTLDLGCEGMKHIQRTVSDIFALYQADYPDAAASAAGLPSTEIQMPTCAGVYTPAHVKASAAIDTEEEYQAKLAAYYEQCRKAQAASIKEHIETRVVMVISELDSQKIDNKMGRVSFMKEPGRKLFLYDSLCQDPLNWTKLRKMKRSFLTGAKVNMTCQQAGQQGADTLAPVKDTYITYKTERQPDQLCEDIVACIVPGISADNPRNDMLDAAWRSLKALGNKHIGPKIGTIQMNKAELLQQVYTRGAWNRTPDHHVVFTYQAVPRQSTGRKRMKYLSDGTSLGDTAFNVWPVPVISVANMPKVSAKIHDDIFDQDVAQDSGAEDGSGAAVAEDLGDNLIPFPRELSDKLAREMIHVWEIDVGVIFNPGSGKALLAFILENRRAVAIVKNKAHKEFLMQTLTDAVKTFNLAPDTRPAKPEEIVAWEARRGGSNAPKAAAPTPAKAPAPAAGVALPPPAAPTSGQAPTLPAPTLPGAPAGPSSQTTSAAGLAAFGSSILR